MRRQFSVTAKVALLLVMGLIVAACAGAPQKPVSLGAGERELSMKVDSLYFEPNYIKAHRGDILTIKMESVARIDHNLTIQTPQGKTLLRVDIPAKGTATAKVNLAEVGTYNFYCDKPLHAGMGMKGRIEVSAP